MTEISLKESPSMSHTKSTKIWIRFAVGLALAVFITGIVAVAGAFGAGALRASAVGAVAGLAPQNAFTGNWTASLSNRDDKARRKQAKGNKEDKDDDADENFDAANVKDNANKIHLNLERRSESGGRNQMGQSYDFADLQGLSREQVLAGGAVKVTLVPHAGRFDCEGRFQIGKGPGTFPFTSNQTFRSAMT